MDRKYAKHIASLLEHYADVPRPKFRLKEHIKRDSLSSFHQWADSKPCEGAFLFKEQSGESLWVLLIDWREQDNFYVTLFPESKSGPIAEIHNLVEDNEEAVLHWRYSPSKRDGGNEERRKYFIDAFLSDEVQISIPSELSQVEDFVEELFSLARSRSKADELDPNKPSTRSSFPEGKLKERLHLSRERNSELVWQAKRAALERDGCLRCACCGFDFYSTYGEIGRGFIEAHHTKPVSTLHVDGEETRIEDLALVCSNCHRMLHRRRPWLEMHQLSQLFLTARV